MKKDDMTVLGCLGLIALFVIVIPASIIMKGWVLSIMWQWFVVPFFHLPELTIAYAVGISMVISLFKDKSSVSQNNEKSLSAKIISAFICTFILPLLSLGFGWIVLQFIH